MSLEFRDKDPENIVIQILELSKNKHLDPEENRLLDNMKDFNLVLRTCDIRRALGEIDQSLLANKDLSSYPYSMSEEQILLGWLMLYKAHLRQPDEKWLHRLIVNAGIDSSPGSIMDFSFSGYRIHGQLSKKENSFFLTFYLECGTQWARGDSETLWLLEFEVVKR